MAADKGSYVYITVDAGNKGSSGTVTVYDMNGMRERRVKTLDLSNCGTSQCKSGIIGTAKLNVYYNWQGKYCARVKDMATKNEVQNCFTVR